MSKTMTRRELYDLVWAQPMTKVAAELGISDVALHKICKKHDIAKPERGYWAKLAAGKRVRQLPLKDMDDPAWEHVIIHGSAMRALPASVLKVKEKAEAAAKSLAAARDESTVDQSAEPHPLVQRLRQLLERAKPGKDGFIHIAEESSLAVSVSPAVVSRLASLLNALVAEAEARGYSIKRRKDVFELEVDGEPIALQVSEQTDRIAHVPTPSESKAIAQWEKSRERAARRREYFSDWDKPKTLEWDFPPTGRLVFRIDQNHHADGIRRTFSDGKEQRLENRIEAMVTAAATCAAAKKARREEDARRKREWEEQEKRRHEQDRRRRLEDKRREFLELQLGKWERARRIEQFIQDYRARYAVDAMSPAVRWLLEWAERQAADQRQAIAPIELSAKLAHYALMDDATDIYSWARLD